MKRSIYLQFYTLIFLFIWMACGSQISNPEDDGDGGKENQSETPGEEPKSNDPITAEEPPKTNYEPLNLKITKSSLSAFPSVETEMASLVKSENEEGEKIPFHLAKYFAYECQMGEDNYCPKTLVLKDKMDHKFTSTTLIGQIYHAELYLRGQNHLIEKAANFNSNEMELASSTGPDGKEDKSGNPLQYILGGQPDYEFSYFSKINQDLDITLFSDPLKSAPRYRLLVIKKPMMSNDHGEQNFMIETYVSLTSDKKEKIMAMNSPGLNKKTSEYHGTRSVLMVNFLERKFIAKYRSGDTEVMVIGQGGRDPESGNLLAGYYYAKTIYKDNEFVGCVNNETQKKVLDSFCQKELGILADGFSVKEYLNLDSIEAKDTLSFQQLLSHANYLTDDLVPLKGEDLKHFPDHIK